MQAKSDLHKHAVFKIWKTKYETGFLLSSIAFVILCLLMYYYKSSFFFASLHSTVGINPRLSDLKGPGTSKLDWRYLEKLIGMNSRFALIHKKAQEQKLLENWTILKKLKEKKSNISPVLKPETSWWLARCPRLLSHRFGC